MQAAEALATGSIDAGSAVQYALAKPEDNRTALQQNIEYFMGQTGSSFTAMPGLDGTNTVTWTKDPAYQGTWQVQTSPNSSAWTNVAGTDNGTSVSYTLPTGMGTLFVRLLVAPAP